MQSAFCGLSHELEFPQVETVYQPKCKRERKKTKEKKIIIVFPIRKSKTIRFLVFVLLVNKKDSRTSVCHASFFKKGFTKNKNNHTIVPKNLLEKNFCSSKSKFIIFVWQTNVQIRKINLSGMILLSYSGVELQVRMKFQWKLKVDWSGN